MKLRVAVMISGFLLLFLGCQESGRWSLLEAQVQIINDEAQATPTPSSSSLPEPWSSQDIGTMDVSGITTYEGSTFTVIAEGSDISGTSDEFHFVYQDLNGDGEIIAKVESVNDSAPWSKAGVMIRETLSPDSKTAVMCKTEADKFSFIYRNSTAGTTTFNLSGNFSTYWVKLTRTDDDFEGFYSTNGTDWTSYGTTNISMAANIYIGLAVSSCKEGTTITTLFKNITVTP